MRMLTQRAPPGPHPLSTPRKGLDLGPQTACGLQERAFWGQDWKPYEDQLQGKECGLN